MPHVANRSHAKTSQASPCEHRPGTRFDYHSHLRCSWLRYKQAALSGQGLCLLIASSYLLMKGSDVLAEVGGSQQQILVRVAAKGMLDHILAAPRLCASSTDHVCNGQVTQHIATCFLPRHWHAGPENPTMPA